MLLLLYFVFVAMNQLVIFDLVAKYREVETTNPPLFEKVKQSVDILFKAFDDFGIDCTIVSYNGGKDSDACAHLWRLALYLYLDAKGRLGEYQETVDNSIFIVFHSPEDFEEINKHLKETVSSIGVQVYHSSKSFKEGVKGVIDHYGTKAVVLGVRRSDPQGTNLNVHTPSTPDYPPFMRVLPLLEWTYGDVWNFLLTFQIPYCELYDQG